jgi:large subunit ribosomal protein L16
VKPGRILFEYSGIGYAQAKEAARLAGYKLPVKTKLVVREGVNDES